MKKRYLIPIVLVIVTLSATVVWQQTRIARVENNSQLQTSVAIFGLYYSSIKDKITVQGNSIYQSKAVIIPWTENVTSPNGKVLAHWTAIIDGIVYESAQTKDVTELLKTEGK